MQRAVESKQYTSFRLAEHLGVAGIAASVGDAYDNALTHSTISHSHQLRSLPNPERFSRHLPGPR
ncbi:hypothetical protein [Streptomyces sp. NPDC056480]|uniref:hypothetical protein n=1 Tax=Streptomyces sp. NPDC056480 TaxID=3345833 RepID=UPI0036BB4D5D